MIRDAVRLAVPDDQDTLEAAYRRLREQDPVVCVDMPDGLRTWVITRYAEGRRALRDPRFIKDLRKLDGPGEGLAGGRYAEDAYVVEGRHMLNTDGADHMRLRGVVGNQLSASSVARREPEIQRIADDLVRAFDTGPGPIDLMGAYARPLPEIVMGRVLGLADEVIARAAGPSRQLGTRDDPRARHMRRAYTDLIDVVREHALAPLPPDRSDSVLGVLHAALARREITRRELVSTIAMLLGAGISSTAIAIGHGAAMTVHTTAILAALLGDPEPAMGVVDELLRHHPPFAFSPWRFASEDVDIGGVTIPRGAVVFVLLASVNRDPEMVAEPERVRVDRSPRFTGLTFGHGPHYCIGSHLARTEILIALRTLHLRCPQLRLAEPYDQVRWKGLLFDRTPVTLPVQVGMVTR